MHLDRRTFFTAATALLVAPSLATRVFADTAPAIAALDKSQLVYLCPTRADGSDSRCQAEVWFVHLDGDIVVCTSAKAWRARAVAQGLAQARAWVGEFGVWKQADGAYLSAPHLRVEGRLEADAAFHARALEAFGAKYPAEWGSWGPRFRDGLADGSRVLLRYRPQA
ncbi:MAG: hypothetical protein AB7Q81_03645 [Gammaproteobacteria bacterium]